MTEKELKALLADMTLEEKVDQMNQVAAGMFSGDGSHGGEALSAGGAGTNRFYS